jgi:hypothetical protein
LLYFFLSVNLELSKLFNGSEVIIIPALPREMTGHVDGIVRIINDSTVFVSDFSKYKHYQTAS